MFLFIGRETPWKPGNERSVAIAIALGAGIVYIAFRGWECPSSYCSGRGRLLAVAVFGLIVAAEWIWRAKGRIVVDEKGLIINRQLVVWSEVRTMAWARARDGGQPDANWGIQQTDGDREPRQSRSDGLSRKDLMDRQMSLMGFWQEVQRQANPQNVLVDADRPETEG